jgi:tetratricopeptide (TPR) repeat protein
MSKISRWHYFDNDGQKQGPYTGREIIQIVRLGTITRETFLEDQNGLIHQAKDLKNLPFHEVGGDTFADEQWDFFNQMTPPTVVVPQVEGFTAQFWIILAGVLVVVAIGGGIALWKVFELMYFDKLNAAARLHIKNDIEKNHPLKIIDSTNANITVNWSDAASIYATGKFTLKAMTSEGLYESIGTDAALRKLGFPDRYEVELNEAKNINNALPQSYRVSENGLNWPPRLYEVLVPNGQEVTLTGSIDMTREGNKNWQMDKDRFSVDPYDVEGKTLPENQYIRESNLSPGTRLDDPITKENVKKIIEAREKFIADVGEAKKRWDEYMKGQDEIRKQAEKHAEQARFQLNQKNFEEARKAIDEALKLNSGNRDYINLRDMIRKEIDKLVVPPPPPQQQSPPPQPPPQLPPSGISLSEEIRKSGFSGRYSAVAFVEFGTSTLQNNLKTANDNRRNVDPFDDTAIKKADAEIKFVQDAIKQAQNVIAQKTFYEDYTYSVSNSKNHGNGTSSFEMSVYPEFDYPAGRGVLFPAMPDVTGSTRNYHTVFVNGNTTSIGELVNNKDDYRVRITFRNLRYYRSYDVAVEIQKIEVIKNQ